MKVVFINSEKAMQEKKLKEAANEFAEREKKRAYQRYLRLLQKQKSKNQ